MKYQCILLLTLVSWRSMADFSAIWEHEWSIDTNGHGQKFETTFDPEWNVTLNDNVSMTFIGRAKLDGLSELTQSSEPGDNFSTINGPLIRGYNGSVGAREWYIDTEIAGTYWRVGKQQVVWGQADGLKVLDVVNPQSYREFILDDFDDSRIPLWMFNVEFPIGEDDSLQLLFIPDQSYHRFADSGSEFEVNSPLFVPVVPDGAIVSSFEYHKPASIVADSDMGFRYSMFYEGWDLTLNYLYHYQDAPVLYQILSDQFVTIDSRYERSHLVGATASNAFGDFTLRAEVGYSSDTFHNSSDLKEQGIHRTADISSVIGIDWQGLEDTLLSVQWFQSHLLKDNANVVRPQTNSILSLLYQQTFANETWELEVLALHGMDQKDGSIQSKINYELQDNVNVWIGADLFYGKEHGLFGQFRDNDRVNVGFEWGF